jgi:hypothetical protein
MKIVVGADVEVQNIGGADPDDSWSRDSTSGYVSNVTAREAKDFEVGKFQWYTESWDGELDVSVGDTIYAVVADYETGDTFGRDGGNAQILDVFSTFEEAEGLAAAALVKQSGDMPEWRRGYEYSFDYNGKTYHRSWAGYFEHLQSLDVWKVVVGGGRKGPGYGVKRGS